MSKNLFIILIVILSSSLIYTGGQLINSITSYQTCASIDPRIQTPADVNPLIQYINCSTSSGELPKITIFDITITGNVGSPTIFNFNLSVVPSNINNPVPQSTDPKKCSPISATTQLCETTVPAQLKVVNTKYALGYQLTKRVGTQIPYCYGSAVQFEQYSYLSSSCQPNGNLTNLQNSICLPIQMTPEHSNAVNAAFGLSSNQADDTTNSCVNFLRAQRIPDLVTYYNGQLTTPIIDGEQLSCKGNYPTTFQFVNQFMMNSVSEIYYGNNHCVDHSGTLCLLSSDPSNNITTTSEPLPCDDASIDIRLPTFMPNPSLNGNTPKPIFADVLHSLTEIPTPDLSFKATAGNPCDMINTASTPNSQVIESFSYICAGASCPANVDNRKVTNSKINKNAKGDIPSSFDYTINSIYGFGPYCDIYDIYPYPKAVAEITIEITTYDQNMTTPLHVETLVIDNFSGGNGVSSSPYKYSFARIDNIGTPSGIIGPALGPNAALIICPSYNAQSSPVFPNMQCLIPGVQCDNNHIVTDWGTQGGLLENPWKTLVAQSNAQIPNRSLFYPHPYDYAKGDSSNGKNPSFTSLPVPSNGVFWYYVPEDVMTREFCTGPNCIGMALNMGSNSQLNNLACNIPPHGATPGIGQILNGGLKTGTPCQISSAMNLNAGWYNNTLFPQDLIFNTPGNKTLLQNASTTSAKFMPNNQFLPNPLYDPQHPNAWIGMAGLKSAATYLFLEPATSQNIQYTNNLQIELIIDVVGSFVGYQTTVSPGQINYNQQQFNCTIYDESRNGTMGLTVTNLSQNNTSFAPPNTTYTLNVNCFFDVTDIVVLNNDQVVTLSPGQTSDEMFFYLDALSGTIDQTSLVCLATLYYTEIIVSAPIADQKNISCNINAVPLFGSPDFILGLPTPNVNQSLPPPINCTGDCPIICEIQYGNPWKLGCFIGIVAFIITTIVVLIGTIILIIYSNVYLKNQEKEASKQINENLKVSLSSTSTPSTT